MRIAIPTDDDQGLESRICAHFGSAPYFTLVDTETGDVRVIANRNAHHAHGTCRPMRQLRPERIDALACRGMGRRAQATLADERIDVYLTRDRLVSEIIASVKAGNAVRMTAADACCGHGAGSPGDRV
ncbi:MAG: diguanylate cyclase [Candidatus Eisenbacteria bacterium]|nr:diguanylate cyclase [Candidatus Latescibacterota bacterium]MBD3301005.1 diguanylate cyclase [Candidatus Eisenbacteria bacterium]